MFSTNLTFIPKYQYRLDQIDRALFQYQWKLIYYWIEPFLVALEWLTHCLFNTISLLCPRYYSNLHFGRENTGSFVSQISFSNVENKERWIREIERKYWVFWFTKKLEKWKHWVVWFTKQLEKWKHWVFWFTTKLEKWIYATNNNYKYVFPWTNSLFNWQ